MADPCSRSNGKRAARHRAGWRLEEEHPEEFDDDDLLDPPEDEDLEDCTVVVDDLRRRCGDGMLFDD
jgi:hypothetical protein